GVQGYPPINSQCPGFTLLLTHGVQGSPPINPWCPGSCRQGKLSCTGEPHHLSCEEPMGFFNCSSAGPGAKGSECQKSCQTLDSHCISAECVSGCVCPDGLLSDGNGGCIKEDLCPCSHNGVYYQPGHVLKVDCNTW
ncbi:unnamed protein product, partial [Oncorhynchus mykiss]